MGSAGPPICSSTCTVTHICCAARTAATMCGSVLHPCSRMMGFSVRCWHLGSHQRHSMLLYGRCEQLGAAQDLATPQHITGKATLGVPLGLGV